MMPELPRQYGSMQTLIAKESVLLEKHGNVSSWKNNLLSIPRLQTEHRCCPYHTERPILCEFFNRLEHKFFMFCTEI